MGTLLLLIASACILHGVDGAAIKSGSRTAAICEAPCAPLYAASNLSSLHRTLLHYHWQTTVLESANVHFFGGYLLLAACVIYCAYTIYNVAPPDSVLAAEAAADAAASAPVPSPVGDVMVPEPMPAAETATAVKSGPAPAARGIQRKKGMKLAAGPGDETPAGVAKEAAIDNKYGANAPMTNWRRLRWVMLAFVPSSLMLGVTSAISVPLYVLFAFRSSSCT